MLKVQVKRELFVTKLGADAFHNLAQNQFVLTMEEGSIFNGTLQKFNEMKIPQWMLPQQGREVSVLDYLFLRIADHHFIAYLREQNVLPRLRRPIYSPKSLKRIYYMTYIIQLILSKCTM